jgi:gluconokinase
MIVVVAGVAGSGKTTVGQLLAARLNCLFADGDSFHPPANVAKMRAGLPLTDADRLPWLAAMTSWMDDVIASGQSAVLASSALKRRYRDELLGGREQAQMVFLQISLAQCEVRLATRTGHFFHEPLLASQFDALELPHDEPRVHVIPVGDRSAGQIVGDIIRLLRLEPAGRPRAS